MVEVELAGLGKRYGEGADAVVALERVDAALGAGEVVGLVGPSGCGKSTLLRAVAGLTAPTSGTVRIRGRDVWAAAEPDVPPGVLGVVFQEANLLPWMSVVDNVALPLRLRGAPRSDRRARARELCAVLGVEDFADRRPAELSIGMRQRAGIARALIESPSLLLLDEPFAALDAITRDAMNLELARVLRASGCAALVVTHSIAEAVFLSDRVIALTPRPGRVAGTADVPFPRPRALALQQAPEFQALVARIRSLLVGGPSP